MSNLFWLVIGFVLGFSACLIIFESKLYDMRKKGEAFTKEILSMTTPKVVDVKRERQPPQRGMSR